MYRPTTTRAPQVPQAGSTPRAGRLPHQRGTLGRVDHVTYVQRDAQAPAPTPRKPRQGWPDLAKGLCIVLVVLWHVVTKHAAAIDWGGSEAIASAWTTVNTQLLPLRMPLFFLISGMFAANAVRSASRSSAARRATRLIGLYVLWLTIQTFALSATPDFDTARADSVTAYLAHLTFSPTNLWFLVALALYLGIGRLTRSVPAPLVLVPAFALSAVASAGWLPEAENLWQVAQNLCFFLLGLRTRPWFGRLADAARLPAALLLGTAFVAGLVLVSVLGAREWFGVWPLLSTVAVALGIIGCALVDRHLPRATAPLRWIGRHTLPIYVVHMIPLAFIDLGIRAAEPSLPMASPAVALLEPLVVTAVVIACCLGFHAVLRRIGLAALFDPLLLARDRAGATATRE